MTLEDDKDATTSQRTPRLEVSVGHEAFEPGWTQVVLDAGGGVEVVCRLEDRDPRHVKAELGAEHAREMIRAAEEHLTGARESGRQGLPDEPRYHFEIRDGEMRRSLDLWRSELPDHPALRRLVAAFQEMLEERTRGEILL
jgi:hypothetical protein